MDKKNKYIFPALVEGKEDILGMIAYAFYKLEKKDFINNIEVTSGKKISSEELMRFQENKYQNLESYKKEAENVLKNVVNRMMESKNKEVLELSEKLKEQNDEIEKKKKKLILNENEIKSKEAYIAQKEKKIKKQENELEKRNQTCKVQKTNFWYGVGQSLLATFIWTCLVLVIVLSQKENIIDFILKKIQ